MKVIVEETEAENKNKRRTIVECESDDIGIDETLDMILRGLLAYGYTAGDIVNTLNRFATRAESEESEPKKEQEELGGL